MFIHKSIMEQFPYLLTGDSPDEQTVPVKPEAQRQAKPPVTPRKQEPPF